MCQLLFEKAGLLTNDHLTLSHSEQPKLLGVLAVLSAIGLRTDKVGLYENLWQTKSGLNYLGDLGETSAVSTNATLY